MLFYVVWLAHPLRHRCPCVVNPTVDMALQKTYWLVYGAYIFGEIVCPSI